MLEKPQKQPFRFPALNLIIWAETEDEAKNLASKEAKKGETATEPNTPEDQNGDISVPGKSPSKSKNIKQ